MAVEERDRKLAELILYISQKSANDPYFGQVKLNKLLFFPDFSAYASWGSTITGAAYQHLTEGPAVYRMLPVQQALKDDGDLAVQRVDFYGNWQVRTVNLRSANLEYFKGAEIALVDAWLERLKPLSGREVSELSHNTASWKLTSDREIIDPRSVFLSWRQPNAAEIKRGQQLALAHGLLASE